MLNVGDEQVESGGDFLPVGEQAGESAPPGWYRSVEALAARAAACPVDTKASASWQASSGFAWSGVFFYCFPGAMKRWICLVFGIGRGLTFSAGLVWRTRITGFKCLFGQRIRFGP